MTSACILRGTSNCSSVMEKFFQDLVVTIILFKYIMKSYFEGFHDYGVEFMNFEIEKS